MEQEKSDSYEVEGLGEATEAERAGRVVAENYFSPSTMAQHKQGVLYQGEFETPGDGTARAVRIHARALADTGIPVFLKSFSNVVVNSHGIAEPVHVCGMPKEVDDEVGHLTRADISEMRPVIKHVVVRSPEHLRQLLMPRSAIPADPNDMAQHLELRDRIYGNTIVYSVWERDRIDPEVARMLALVNQCWVPCQQNAQLLIGAGVPKERVHVVPHPYDDRDQIGLLTTRPGGMHGGWKRFYSIGRWEPRKGFQQLIVAFVCAFKHGDKASLTIKYSGSGKWPEYLAPDDVLQLAVRIAPPSHGWDASNIGDHVKLIDGRVKHSQIVGLHLENNIYVSASHGEAWGLPAFDAARAGNRIVYVDWGGICDFAGPEDVAIKHHMVDVHPSYRWGHGAQWASCSIEQLAEALRVAAPPAAFVKPPLFEKQFSMAAVGKKMRELVDLALR